MSNKFFELGDVVATPGVLQQIRTFHQLLALERHQSGDWGDLDPIDRQTNNDALKHGGRLFSVYTYDMHKFYIITEADRSVTTLLLPEEY